MGVSHSGRNAAQRRRGPLCGKGMGHATRAVDPSDFDNGRRNKFKLFEKKFGTSGQAGYIRHERNKL